jgi:hypothetical protein
VRQTMSRLVALVLFSAVVAGCLAEPRAPPPEDRGLPGLPPEYTREYPRAKCIDGTLLNLLGDWGRNVTGCNVRTTVTHKGNEVTIAVNPKDPGNIVAGAKDYTQPGAGQCVWDGIYTTKDTGQTWKNQQVPGSNWARLSNPTEPVTPLSKHWCATDPVLGAGPNGEFYYSVMGYQCDPVSASPTGDGVLPQGGLNDWAFNCVQMYVLKSTDGGLTWPQITALTPAGSYPVSFNDRQWLHVDPLTGDVYVGWIVFHGVVVENWFYYSSDGGQTFVGPRIVSQNPGPGGVDQPGGGGQGTMITSGPGGAVYMSWNCGANTRLVVSRDGGRNFDLPVNVPTKCNSKVLYPSPENSRGLPRVPDAPFPAADYGDGPYSGNLYFVARTDAFGHADMGFLRSTDQGRTWSNLTKLNDDNATDAAQFFGAISVNRHGVLDVVWYDQRNDPDHHRFDLYYTYSLDGGDTWAPNVRVTEVMSAPEPSKHQNGMVFIGDYIDIDSSDDYAHPVWVDTRNGQSDVYTAWIERPAYPIGHPARGA